MRAIRLFFTLGICVSALVPTMQGQAQAQSQVASKPGPDTGQALNTGGALAPAGGAVDTSQGGVGGTGLGKMPAANSDGKGMSVKGPAGQGIDPMKTPGSSPAK